MRAIFCIPLFLISGVAFCQNLYNESIISIGPSSVLFVKDTIINEGTIVNNGDMQVGGSWINNAQYEAGHGQITFNSDHPQIINHNDQSFSRLTISGGGEKIFQADITIENELNLTDGLLVSQNNSRIVILGSAVVAGGSDASHIRGPVYHRGAGNKTFPLGNGSLYLPVSLLNVEGNSPEVGFSAFELDNGSLQTSPSLKSVSDRRYWEMDLISGSVSNSSIVLPVRNEEVGENTEAIVVAQAESVTDPFENLGQSAFQGTLSNGMVTSRSAVSKKVFAVGTAVSGEGIVIYNAISPNGDAFNNVLIIGNIENHQPNKFSLFNRWGDKVFEIQDYDNGTRAFRGKSNIGGEKELVSGTYFYNIETESGLRVNGFLALKK